MISIFISFGLHSHYRTSSASNTMQKVIHSYKKDQYKNKKTIENIHPS
jgi:hypothetical protein